MDKHALIIAGPRDLHVNHNVIFTAIEASGLNPYIIISGAAKGVDTAAYNFAVRYGYFPIKIPARWDYWREHGKVSYAGPERNAVQAYLGDALLVIKRAGVDTPGTTSMIKEAEKRNLPTHIYEVR